MVDTNWRAVALGFVTIVVLGLLGAYVEQLSFLGAGVAGIIGGLVAGYTAHSGSKNGAWNGFLAGSIGALIMVTLLVALGLAVSIVTLSLGGIFATAGVALAALVLIALAAIPATLGGFIGGMIEREKPMDTKRPAA
ncbi:DUF5518 domain-containing protein [Haloarchaeobius sp. TZWWS8]|uniref:DUF5518 domain-containing protein n=1 Tax=Haloarchaeobius sp. TZWWS8 TaxID=3446121 RepID=UPI003EBC52EF